jgi:hypothetical protein
MATANETSAHERNGRHAPAPEDGQSLENRAAQAVVDRDEARVVRKVPLAREEETQVLQRHGAPFLGKKPHLLFEDSWMH